MQDDFLSNEHSTHKYPINFTMPQFLRLSDPLMGRNVPMSEESIWDTSKHWDSSPSGSKYKDIIVPAFSQPVTASSSHKPLECGQESQYEHLIRDIRNSRLPDHLSSFSLTQAPSILSPLPSQPCSSSHHQFLPYSPSGFDMLKILSKVVSRSNPKIMLGPVDMTCSFAVADARHPDIPIVYASPTFCRLTGYSEPEVLGQNCRFLQSPTGVVHRGEPRTHTAVDAVRHFYRSLLQERECQASLINYRKDGSPFVNLVTIIPISEDDNGEITHFVGFQVDISEHPSAVLQKLRDGSYFVNYSIANLGPGGIRDRRGRGVSSELIHMIRGGSHEPIGRETERNEICNLMLNNIEDFIHVLSLKGSLLYAAPSISRVLGYDAQELIGKSIADLCHPADVVPVMRELKDASSVPIYQVSHSPPRLSYSHDFPDLQQPPPPARPTSLLFRALHKDGHYVWIISRGRLHVEPGKGRKAVVLVGRRLNSGILDAVVTRLLERRVSQPEPFGENGWGLVAPNGIILFANTICSQRLGFSTALTIAPSHALLVSANASAHTYQRYTSSHPGDTHSHLSHNHQHHSHYPPPIPFQGPPASLNYFSQIPATLVGRHLGSLVIDPGDQQVLQALVNASATYNDSVTRIHCKIRGYVSGHKHDETMSVEIRFYSTTSKDNFASRPSSIIFEMIFFPDDTRETSNTLHSFSSLSDYGLNISNEEQNSFSTHIPQYQHQTSQSLDPPFFKPQDSPPHTKENPYPYPLQTDAISQTGTSSSSSPGRVNPSTTSSFFPNGATAILRSPIEGHNTHDYHAPVFPTPASPPSLVSHSFPAASARTQDCQAASESSQSTEEPSILSSLSTSPTSETSWQYELTRLRFENERMRVEVAKLERVKERYRRAKLNSFPVATSPTSLKRPRSRELESTK